MNIFVAKLDFNISDDSLRELFEEFGEVNSAKIIMDRETGRSRGFGFVDMTNDPEAYKAIGELNGAMIDGREIIVKKAEPREIIINGIPEDSGNEYRDRFNRGGGNRFNRGGGDRYNRGGGDRYNRGGGDRFNRNDRFNRGGDDRFNRNDHFNQQNQDTQDNDQNDRW
jgi:RNA recognition motif-containing protein